MEPLPVHRIAIEPRSGIWLLFYETLISSPYIRPQEDGFYKQQLLRIIGHRISSEIRFETAQKIALIEIAKRKVTYPLVYVIDDSQKNVMLRKA